MKTRRTTVSVGCRHAGLSGDTSGGRTPAPVTRPSEAPGLVLGIVSISCRGARAEVQPGRYPGTCYDAAWATWPCETPSGPGHLRASFYSRTKKGQHRVPSSSVKLHPRRDHTVIPPPGDQLAVTAACLLFSRNCRNSSLLSPLRFSLLGP